MSQSTTQYSAHQTTASWHGQAPNTFWHLLSGSIDTQHNAHLLNMAKDCLPADRKVIPSN